jgi:hypothetical protein
MTSPVFTVRPVLLALSSSAMAAQTDARWIKVFADSSETTAVDSASVLPVGDGIYRVWERGVSRQTSEVRALARVEFDCRLRLARLLAVAYPGAAPVRAAAEPRDWDGIPPNSRFEAEWQHLCSLAAPGATRR